MYNIFTRFYTLHKRNLYKFYSINSFSFFDYIFILLHQSKKCSNFRKSRELVLHLMFVALIADKISSREEKLTFTDKKIILISSLLHDIKKFKKNKEHEKINLSTINKFLDYDDKIYAHEIRYIIRYHRKGKFNKAKYKYKSTNTKNLRLLCQIVYDADKISKLFKYNTWQDCNDSVENLEIKILKIKKKLKLVNSTEILNKYVYDLNKILVTQKLKSIHI